MGNIEDDFKDALKVFVEQYETAHQVCIGMIDGEPHQDPYVSVITVQDARRDEDRQIWALNFVKVGDRVCWKQWDDIHGLQKGDWKWHFGIVTSMSSTTVAAREDNDRIVSIWRRNPFFMLESLYKEWIEPCL